MSLDLIPHFPSPKHPRHPKDPSFRDKRAENCVAARCMERVVERERDMSGKWRWPSPNFIIIAIIIITARQECILSPCCTPAAAPPPPCEIRFTPFAHNQANGFD